MKCGTSGIPLPDIVWTLKNSAWKNAKIDSLNCKQTENYGCEHSEGENSYHVGDYNGEDITSQIGKYSGEVNVTNFLNPTKLGVNSTSPVVVSLNEEVIASKIYHYMVL